MTTLSSLDQNLGTILPSTLQVGASIGVSMALERTFLSAPRLIAASSISAFSVVSRLGLDLWDHKDLGIIKEETAINLLEAFASVLIPGESALLLGALIAGAAEGIRSSVVYHQDLKSAFLSGALTCATTLGFGLLLNSVVSKWGEKYQKQETEQLLDNYISPNKLIRDVENRKHLERLMKLVDQHAPTANLTPRQVRHLKLAMAGSDVGKNMDWVKESFHKSANGRFHLTNSLAEVNKLNLEMENPTLDGIVDWLRTYQRETKAPLDLKPLKSLKQFQEAWGFQPFKMRGLPGEALHPEDRLQALRFSKIIFNPSIEWFPIGLYFHEIPGYATLYANKAPRTVLNALFGHNGPESNLLADGTEGVGLLKPFWGADFFKPIKGKYPFPMKGDRLGWLHTALDRADQGGLVKITSPRPTLEGGFRKILLDDMTGRNKTPLECLSELLPSPTDPNYSLARSTQQQIHSLFYNRPPDKALGKIYKKLIAQLQNVDKLADQIDFNLSSSYKIIFKDGTEIAATQEFEKESKNLTSKAAQEFAEKLFEKLAHYFEA